MKQALRFDIAAKRFEELVEELNQCADRHARKQVLIRMWDVIGELDGFVYRYLRSLGEEPSSRAQAGAALFAKRSLGKA